MKIAILGSTSEIAQDMVFSFGKEHDFDLFHGHHYYHLSASANYDAIINFVGAGSPDKIASMGTSIFDITDSYDTIALDYVRCFPKCKYIFLSSGVAGNPRTPYGYAKMRAECRHRGHPELPIVDVRVFSYFSHTQTSSGFFMSDVVKALKTGTVMKTGLSNTLRDYIGPEDFHQMIDGILKAPPTNCAVEMFSKESVCKFDLLNTISEKFGLHYQSDNLIEKSVVSYIPTISIFKSALFKYKPKYTSLETVMNELEKVMSCSN